jgi:hypothetical protein
MCWIVLTDVTKLAKQEKRTRRKIKSKKEKEEQNENDLETVTNKS